MRDWEDDEGPDPDYGVFGDAGMPRPPIPAPDPKRDAQVRRQRQQRDSADKVSRDFNSYMIDLFNSRSRGEPK